MIFSHLTCEDIKFSRQSSPSISLVFIWGSLLIIFSQSLTLHHTIWTPKRLQSHTALLPSKIKFTVSYRSFLSKPNPPALSGSCKFIEGFSRYFLAPFMASFVNKEAFLSAGFQVRFMKHPLPSSHRSQVLFISLNKPKNMFEKALVGYCESRVHTNNCNYFLGTFRAIFKDHLSGM